MRPNGYEYELEIQPTAPIGYEPDTRTRWQKLKDWVLRREYEPTPIYPENTQALFIETTGVNGAVVRHHIPGRCGHCSPDRALRTEGRGNLGGPRRILARDDAHLHLGRRGPRVAGHHLRDGKEGSWLS